MVGRARGEAAALCRPRAGNGAVPAACAPASAPVPAPARLGPASGGVGAAGSRAPAGAGPAGPGRAAALLITATGTAEGRVASAMQGNGEKAAGNGRQEGLGGRGAADGELQAAAVPMLPALEVAEEPEKAPGGKSKDPNTYKVLSLVRAGRARWAATRAGGPRLSPLGVGRGSSSRGPRSPLGSLRLGSTGAAGCLQH